VLAAVLSAVATVPSAGQASKNRLATTRQIAAYVNDNPQDADLSLIWKTLGVEITGQAGNRCGCGSDDCPGTCEAAVFDVGRESPGSWRRILRICYAGGADCRYIVFTRERGWRVAGLIESLDNQYRPPEHRLVSSEGRCWLAIKQLSGRGTGFLSYSELWYDLMKSNLPVVLAYPVSGHSVQGVRSQDYEFTSTLSLNRESPLSILVRYRVRELPQKFGSGSIDWGADKSFRVWYEWDAGRFRLRGSRSVLPDESDAVYFLTEKARHTESSVH